MLQVEKVIGWTGAPYCDGLVGLMLCFGLFQIRFLGQKGRDKFGWPLAT